MKELIDFLKAIAVSLDGCTAWYPGFLDPSEIYLNNFERQESDVEGLEFEYISQQQHGEDNFSGEVVYPFRDIFIKVQFDC